MSSQCAFDLESPDPLLTAYLGYRRSNSALKTLIRLHDDLYPWSEFMTQRGGVLTATQQLAQEYMAGLRCAPGSKWNVIYSCRKFHQWLMDNEYLGRNPWARIEGPRRPQHQPRVLAEVELSRLATALRTSSVMDLRDRALVMFLCDTGCRINEALTLAMRDIDLPEVGIGAAVVTGKGGKDRTVYFTHETVEGLRSWLVSGRGRWVGRNTASGAVFVGKHGKPLSYSTARAAIVRLERRANLGRHVNPHLLRHTFATDALKHGMNLRALQELMGHASLRSTEIYLHLVDEDLRNSYQRAVVRRNMNEHGTVE